MELLAKYHLRNYPPEILLKKLIKRPIFLAEKRKQRKRALNGEGRNGAYGEHFRGAPLVRLKDLSLEGIQIDTARWSLNAYAAHHFDILGSGWVNWNYGAKAEGLEGFAYEGMDPGVDREGKWLERVLSEKHLALSKEIWNGIQGAGYRPIDWQRDMKSGFRWNAKRWSGDQAKLNKGKAGADPKVPIELGRLQHLPRMAVLAGSLEEGRERWVREFHDQVRDFLAANPPGMGINWHYAMDVGIRVSNLVLAYDLFRQLDEGNVLGRDFQITLSEAICQHAEYIMDNLEYQDGLTGNHYLFNIAGLLFAGSALQASDLSDSWLLIGLRELIRELFKQFSSDGGNFEGSTAYHCLGTEMLVWCSALVYGNKDRLVQVSWDETIHLSKWSLQPPSKKVRSSAASPFPPAYLERLNRVCRSALDLTKPNGEHPQIGDNDSGRLFKLTPFGTFLSPDEWASLYGCSRPELSFERGNDRIFDENLLEMGSLISAISGLFPSLSRPFDSMNGALEHSFIRNITGGTSLEEKDHDPKGGQMKKRGKEPKGLSYEKTTEVPFLSGDENLLKGGAWHFYPMTGWYIYRSAALYLIFNAPEGRVLRHTWGHVHNDRLSFELFVKNQDLVVDPGSYVYGALPEERNRFRSGMVHNIPYVEGEEQNRWTGGESGLFYLKPESRCWLIASSDHHIEAGLRYRGIVQVRKLTLKADKLVIEDRSSHPFRAVLNRGDPYSKGYGKKIDQGH